MNNLIYLSIFFLLFGLFGEAIAEDPLRVYLSDQEGNPVTNATMQIQVEPGSVMIGQDDESQRLSFRHTGNGEYRSEEPPLSGSHYKIELEVDAPGYAGQTFLLTQSGRVRSEYRFTLEADSEAELEDEVDDVMEIEDQPVMEAAPKGTTIYGNLGFHMQGAQTRSLPEGHSLVFALSVDEEDDLGVDRENILGYAKTRNLNEARDRHDVGSFQIDGLPQHGDIVLVAFNKEIQLLFGALVISLDEVEDVNPSDRHSSYSVGDKLVLMPTNNPAAYGQGPANISGQGALKGKGKALQVLALAGWISERVMNMDAEEGTEEIIDLTNLLIAYYEDKDELSKPEGYLETTSERSSELIKHPVKKKNQTPEEIKNKVKNLGYDNPCIDGNKVEENFEGPFRISLKKDSKPGYLLWGVGCPKTRGRGFVILFDADTKNYLGSHFGYNITGTLEHSDSADRVAAKFDESKEYATILIEGRNNTLKLIYDELEEKYNSRYESK